MSWAEGQALQPLVLPPLTREQLADYAAASKDHNPIHLDETFAKNLGFPSVIVHGMLSMAFLADHLSANFPQKSYHVSRFRVRFRKVTYPGDVLTCKGEVKSVLPDGKLLVAVRTESQKGEVTTDAEAEVTPV